MNEATLHRSVKTWFDAVLPMGARVLHIPTRAPSKKVGYQWKLKGVTPGWPDFFVWFGPGEPVGIELKTQTGRLNKDQIALHEWAQDNDRPWHVCRSIDDVERVLRRYGVPLKVAG